MLAIHYITRTTSRSVSCSGEPPDPFCRRAFRACGTAHDAGEALGPRPSARNVVAVDDGCVVDSGACASHWRRSRPDGGVVTQRTANPCTPVRFRLGPPLLPFL